MNPLKIEPGNKRSSFAFEVVDKVDDISDYENTEIVEYITEDHIIGDYEVGSESSYDQSSSNLGRKQGDRRTSLFAESECEIFGTFIGNELKTMPLKKKNLFKRQVLQLLLDMGSD